MQPTDDAHVRAPLDAAPHADAQPPAPHADAARAPLILPPRTPAVDIRANGAPARADALPATPVCANCGELRRLLALMRHRVNEVEHAYITLKAERDALLARASGTPAPESTFEVTGDGGSSFEAEQTPHE